MIGAAMRKTNRVLPLCLASLLAFAVGTGTAMAQTATQPGSGGTATMGKHGHTGRHSRTHGNASGKLKGEEFDTQMAAKAHCPSQTVVWVNRRGHVFHLPKSKFYGKTKHGAYVCQSAAESAGLHAAKS